MDERILMEGVRDYAEDHPVYLDEEKNRLVICAINEGGFNCTLVDIEDLINWLRENRPDILEGE